VSRLSVRRLDSLDDQPQRERHFEHEHRHPHKKGHVDKSDEPQGKRYQEQHRGEYAGLLDTPLNWLLSYAVF
jgi:hypothetical protein